MTLKGIIMSNRFKWQKRLLLTTCVLATVNLNADITGFVYQDLPVKPDTIANGYATKATYGLKDGIEVGVKGVTVKGIDDLLDRDALG